MRVDTCNGLQQLQQLAVGTACLSRGQEQAPPCSQPTRSSSEGQSQCWQDLCRTGRAHESAEWRGEAGAVTDLALTNRGESLADLVKQLSVARLQLGHFVLKSTVRQSLLLFLYTV